MVTAHSVKYYEAVRGIRHSKVAVIHVHTAVIFDIA
jgi:hypothetical protein